MAGSGSKVDLYAAIRRDSREGKSQRAIMAAHNVGRSTVLAAEASVWPQPRKPQVGRTSKLDDFKPAIDAMMRADLDAPRKQRHTVRRIYDRLVEEHAMTDVSYGTVRDWVAARRPQIWIESGRGQAQAFVLQSHQPGAEGEVDFGEVAINLAGQMTVCTLFSFRLSYSGRAVHRVFATAGQEAFLEGHVHAFTAIGGVPFGKVRYDNLKAAVSKVIGFARMRTENQRWVAFRSHYAMEAFYCQPGITGAHEKGGVEGDIGRFRRNHFVPIPDVATLDELNAMVDEWDAADDLRRIGDRPHSITQMFTTEKPALKPLPEEVFETGLWLHPRVDRYAQITVRNNKYSVPVRMIGRPVRVVLHASHLIVYDRQVEIARHERLMGKSVSRLELDHYLEVLAYKPGALPGSTALEQARAGGKFTAAHEAWWAAVSKAHGDRDGTRALIEVLLLHRHLPHADVVAGLRAALTVGALTADAVALEARKAAEAHSAAPADLSAQSLTKVTAEPGAPAVTSLTMRRLAQLPPDNRPLPSLAIYDSLLRLHRTSPSLPASPSDRSASSNGSPS